MSERAPRCLVCGHQFTDAPTKSSFANAPLVGGAGLPELHLSVPIAVGLLALFLIVGAGLTYAVMAATGGPGGAQAAVTPSTSPTPHPLSHPRDADCHRHTASHAHPVDLYGAIQ